MSSRTWRVIRNDFRFERKLAWICAILIFPILVLCILWEVRLWAVVPLVATLTVPLWWRKRSIHSVLIALSLTLAGATAVLWGQALWGPAGISCSVGQHRLNLASYTTAIYISLWSGGAVRSLSAPPWAVIAAFLAYPAAAVIWGPAHPKRGTVRHPRLPSWVSVAIAVLSFLLFCEVGGLLAVLLFSESNPSSTPGVLAAMTMIVFSAPIAVALFLARRVYLRLRWRLVPDETPCCQSCGCNLTGDLSGVCPECGALV